MEILGGSWLENFFTKNLTKVSAGFFPLSYPEGLPYAQKRLAGFGLLIYLIENIP